jgi:2-keto-3-deoxy-L-rhamnonate aldolase RhmA
MALKLMYITNKENIAKIAENNGVDWIFIDLEINGKEERQGHLDTVISRHDIADVKKVKEALIKAELLVRINPIYDGSQYEIDRVINDGADIVMLPFFKSKEEVEAFVGYINGRVKTCLLLETPEAVEDIDSILTVQGVDCIHIGLNDLHLGYHKKFMFELLTDGTVERLCNKFRQKGITYGFGGIAQIGQGTLPAENIIAEHYRLGSDMVILSRGFCNQNIIDDLDEIGLIFNTGIKKIREFESGLKKESESYFIRNQTVIKEKVTKIVYQKI